MGKTTRRVKFYESWAAKDDTCAWMFNIPWKRKCHKTKRGAQLEFLKAAAVVAREAERIREEAKREND